MTEEQKKRILHMRLSGMTYAEIADELALSVNTIKSFCRRNIKTKSCKYCGKSISQPYGTRQKKFCSDKCRMLWWNSHRNDVSKKTISTYKCKCCGKPFQAYASSHRKFCSRICYIMFRFGGLE